MSEKATSTKTPKKTALKATFEALAGHVAVRWIGLLKEMLIAARFGTSYTLDLFLLCFNFISLINTSVFGSIKTTLIPAVVREQQKKQQPRLLLGAALVGGTFALLIFPSLALIIPKILSNNLTLLSHDERNIFLSDLNHLVIWAVLFGILSILHAGLHTERKFFLSSVLPTISAACVCIALLTVANVSVRTIIHGLQVGACLELVLLVLVLQRAGFQLRPKLKGAVTLLQRPLQQAFLLFWGSFLISSNLFIDQFMAQHAGPGSVSLLHFSARIPVIITSLAMSSVGFVILPYLSDLIVNRQMSAGVTLMKRQTRTISFVAMLACLSLYLFSEFLSDLLYGYGEMTNEDVLLVSQVQGIYLLASIFQISNIVPIRMLLALEKSQILSVVAAIGFVLNIMFNLVFLQVFGLIGIALSTLLVESFVGLLIRIYMKSKLSLLEY
jgi:putative peptidoglycan lipid II flippase